MNATCTPRIKNFRLTLSANECSALMEHLIAHVGAVRHDDDARLVAVQVAAVSAGAPPTLTLAPASLRRLRTLLHLWGDERLADIRPRTSAYLAELQRAGIDPFAGLRGEFLLCASVPQPDFGPVDEHEFRAYTEGARQGVLLLRSMPDEALLAAARDSDSDAYKLVFAFMGSDTNPSWITAQAAATAYERSLIDERELDHLTD